MKKIIAVFIALFFAMAAFAGPASATGPNGGGGNDQPAENKKVTFCHATGSATNPYTKNEVSINAFLGNGGHQFHEDDIWDTIVYTTKGGDTVTIPAQGDTSLLAFPDCNKPRVDTKITKPEPVYFDKCGTENDVFSVAPGTGYTVSPITYEGNNMVIKVTLLDGYAWAPDGNKQELRFVKNAFTDEDCGLPETGGEAQYNVNMGIGAVALLLLGAGAFFLIRRKA